MPRESGDKVYTERRWYCHHCGYGPLSCRLDVACPNLDCGHGRCVDCQVVKMKYASHR